MLMQCMIIKDRQTDTQYDYYTLLPTLCGEVKIAGQTDRTQVGQDI